MGGRRATPRPLRRNYFLPRDYEGVADQVVLVDGDHDLLGDGSVELLSTPGHTPGHQSVRVGEHLVIGGDVTHFAAGLDDHRLPLFGDDLDAQLASAERLHALREAGADVRPGTTPRCWRPGRSSGRRARRPVGRFRDPGPDAADPLDLIADDVARALRRRELVLGRHVELGEPVEQVPGRGRSVRPGPARAAPRRG